MRIIIATTFIIGCFATILFIFWKQEIRYTLPTPKPAELNQIPLGESIHLDFIVDTSKTTFIHYYNYDCPCSRFNIQEFKRMVYQFKDSINFIAIVQAADPEKNASDLFKEKYALDIPVLHDENGMLAKKLGVYSTPQAVIIKNNQLYYRGNYNKARFCTSKNTKFAEMALSDALENKKTPRMPIQAIVAYGCELPSNGNDETTNIFNF